MAVKRLDIVGSSLPILGIVGDNVDRDDFRDVPASDSGNDSYSDAGMLGSYRSDREPFEAPDDVRFFSGYGASDEDLDRGYVRVNMREEPAYDLANYKMRSSLPREADEDSSNTDTMPDDWEFRRRNERSKGFLTRPRIATER